MKKCILMNIGELLRMGGARAISHFGTVFGPCHQSVIVSLCRGEYT